MRDTDMPSTTPHRTTSKNRRIATTRTVVRRDDKARKWSRPPRLSDAQRWTIDALVPLGYAHRYIASWVFAKTTMKVTDQERRQITRYIYTRQMHVTDWRNGLSSQAHSFAQKALLGTTSTNGSRRQ